MATVTAPDLLDRLRAAQRTLADGPATINPVLQLLDDKAGNRLVISSMSDLLADCAAEIERLRRGRPLGRGEKR